MEAGEEKNKRVEKFYSLFLWRKYGENKKTD